ncbi:MAG TPA: hypothetical protein VMJ10_13070 [Kofleriaceae bacterium]|nr:hypothetical protein [Kofleriaceae bacterium]
MTTNDAIAPISTDALVHVGGGYRLGHELYRLNNLINTTAQQQASSSSSTTNAMMMAAMVCAMRR